MSLSLRPGSSVDTPRRGRRTWTRAVALGVALATTGFGLGATVATAAPPPKVDTASPFGANVTVFDPSMPVETIQAALDATYAKQVDNEMGSERYAFLFRGGTYGSADEPVLIKVGYYAEIGDLGASPTDVTIHVKVEV